MDAVVAGVGLVWLEVEVEACDGVAGRGECMLRCAADGTEEPDT